MILRDLRDLTDNELIDGIYQWGEDDNSSELRRRLADLRASISHAQIEREEAFQSVRRLLNRVERLIGGLDESKDLLAAAQADRDRLREAMKEIMSTAGHPEAAEGCRLIIGVARAALKEEK